MYVLDFIMQSANIRESAKYLHLYLLEFHWKRAKTPQFNNNNKLGCLCEIIRQLFKLNAHTVTPSIA